MERNEIKVKAFPILSDKFSIKVLFTFLNNSLEFYEQVEDPISKCLSNLNQIQFILDMEEKNSIFFFFVGKLFKKFLTKKMIILR